MQEIPQGFGVLIWMRIQPSGGLTSAAALDLGHELGRVAFDHLPDFRPELMEEVDPRIAANRGTKSLER